MFREMLLESNRRRSRWPMFTAFALELIVAGLLIVLPLFSSGIISSQRVLACPQLDLRLDRPRVIDDYARTGPSGSTGQGTSAAHPETVVTLTGNTSHISIGSDHPELIDGPNPPLNIGTEPSGSRQAICESCLSTEKPSHGPPPRFSVISEGQLLNRVEPVYPRIAALTGIRGEVKLYAIIAKDGTIQSLRVISGHPILAKAAIEAVEQWRYRPYILNKEPIEVETFITVNFKDLR